MKKLHLSLFLLFFISLNNIAHEIIPNPFEKFFSEAYQENPTIPKGMLEAVSYGQTRFAHIQPEAMGSCIGLPQVYGVMGLTLDGKNYFRNNLNKVSQLSGITVEEIIGSPEKNIKAYAKAYAAIQAQLSIGNIAAQQIPVLIELSELPNDEDLQTNFALNSQLYVIYWFLNNDQFQVSYGFPNHNLKLEEIFGVDNYNILSSPKITIGETINNSNGSSYKVNTFSSVQSSDYAPALWNPAPSCNYGSRGGTAISAITIHDMEGAYASAIAWFKNCASNVAAHYCMRSSDGQITQMVLESKMGHHVGSQNAYTIGIEHEGYANTASWWTNVMYNSSAALVRDICNSGYGINPLRTFNGTGCSGPCPLGACVKIKGHQHFPGQSHWDPGAYWDWKKYYNLINNNPTITSVTAVSGTIYDSGGPNGSYNNDERKVILIQPTGATSITLKFTAFDLENNWDYLYIYNGATVNSPLIGKFTGTTIPAAITSSTGSLLLDFRSDCATTNSGWIANYTSNSNTIAGIDQLEKQLGLEIYPNPSSGKVNIDFNLNENHNISVIVTDLLGRMIESIPDKQFTVGETKLSLAENVYYSSGVYLVNIIADGKLISKKLIMQQ